MKPQDTEKGMPRGLNSLERFRNGECARSRILKISQASSIAKGTEENFDLANLGLESNIERDVSTISIIATGWNICNSWAAIPATLALSIPSGGPVTLIYGLLVIFILVGSSAASMAEIASVYPTAGGQYHWTCILSPRKYSRGLSYVCGMVNLFGWVATSASVSIAVSQQILGIVAFFDDSYVAKPWHFFLVYQALTFVFIIYNLFLLKRTTWANNVGFCISVVGFFVTLVTCLARSPLQQTSKFVWTSFENSTGWNSNGVVFFIGLVNANYIYAGLDGAVHLAEECKNASKAIPLALMSTIFIGIVTAFAFAVAIMYSYTDFDAVLASPLPVLEVYYQATRSKGASTALLLICSVCGGFGIMGCIQTASRLTWAFARDKAIVGSPWLGKIHPKLGVPVGAIFADWLVIFIIGCIYLGSSTAFNAMIGTGLVLQQVSFAFPAALLLYQRRTDRLLPKSRTFNLGLFGWASNFLTVAGAIIVVIFYEFPTVMPVQSGNMNYISAVLGVMFVFASINWIIYARKRYQGPRLRSQLNST